jgi:hypothetical protein
MAEKDGREWQKTSVRNRMLGALKRKSVVWKLLNGRSLLENCVQSQQGLSQKV